MASRSIVISVSIAGFLRDAPISSPSWGHSLSGTFTLEINTDGPTIAIDDPDRGEMRLKACMSLKANGHLRGFFVAKKGIAPHQDILVWFPARKKRRTKKRKPTQDKGGR